MAALLRWSLCMAVGGLLLGLAGTGLSANKEPAGKVDIRGSVTRVTTADEAARKKGLLGVVLIEGVKDKDTSYDKASVKVTDKTRIEKLAGTERKPAKFEDLKKGCKVQAVFTGPVAESYPVQATASAIVILEEPR